jgi:hypothetical protein
VDEAAGVVLEAAETGPDGRWAITLKSAPQKLLIIARCRGEALGMVAEHPHDGADRVDLEITDAAPTHPLTIRLAGDDLPDWVRPQIRLTPVRIGALDPLLLRWIHAPVHEAANSTLAGFIPDERQLAIAVQEGEWWLTAVYSVDGSGRFASNVTPPVSWIAASAVTSDGGSLPAANGGFIVEVTGPVAVTLTLKPRA